MTIVREGRSDSPAFFLNPHQEEKSKKISLPIRVSPLSIVLLMNG